MNRTILLNPGPVTLSPRVRAALPGPDLCHRETEFFDLQDEIRARLLSVYDLDPDRWAAVLLSGSGTAGVEAMIGSLVPGDHKIIALDNGVYGKRMHDIAQIYGCAPETINHDWGAAIDTARLDQALSSSGSSSWVTVVHHETTTGRLNDIQRVAGVCRAHGATLLLDAVSSFGAEWIDFEGWGITACAGVSNKCLHGIPGVAFVIVRREALEAASSICRSLYLDLHSHCAAQDKRSTPFTPSVPALVALQESFQEFEEQGGWRARNRCYHERSVQIEEGFEALQLRPMLSRDESSVVLRAWHLPTALTYEALHDTLKRDGFIVYRGQGALAEDIFRIAVMGDISKQDIERLIDSLGRTLSTHVEGVSAGG